MAPDPVQAPGAAVVPLPNEPAPFEASAPFADLSAADRVDPPTGLGVQASQPAESLVSEAGRVPSWSRATELEATARFAPIPFDFDSAQLRFEGRRRLDSCAKWLAEHPDTWLTLEGHCDSSGSMEYNYNLGMARAWSARDYLLRSGLDPNRIFAASLGEERPIAEERTEADRAQNRRVELHFFLAPAGVRSIEMAPSSPSPPPDPSEPVVQPEAIEVP